MAVLEFALSCIDQCYNKAKSAHSHAHMYYNNTLGTSMQKGNQPLNTGVFQIQITVFQRAVIEFTPRCNDQRFITTKFARFHALNENSHVSQ